MKADRVGTNWRKLTPQKKNTRAKGRQASSRNTIYVRAGIMYPEAEKRDKGKSKVRSFADQERKVHPPLYPGQGQRGEREEGLHVKGPG